MKRSSFSCLSRKVPLLLLILDGVGLGKKNESNAFFKAKTPCLDNLFQGPLFTKLCAHGKSVGMPTDSDMGNSEVGHNALGAGRVFDQGASLVQKSFDTGSIFKAPGYTTLKKNHRSHNTLHTIGLLSDGNVHSHISHLLAFTKKAAEDGFLKIRCHILLDGRDVAGRSALSYIETLEKHLDSLNTLGCDAAIASGGGRMTTTMDRYNAEWDMVKRGWEAHVLGISTPFNSATEAVKANYDTDPHINDQYIKPFTICKNGKAIGCINDGDSVVMMNFRGDRAIELSMAFEAKNFTYFDRKRVPKVFYAGMMEYDGDTKCPQHFLVDPPQIKQTLAEHFCQEGIRSLAISETQKYGHVTYFWNGNRSGYFNKKLETFVEIPSDTIPFDQAPKMKAQEITFETIKHLKSGQIDFARVNFPNGDMVGHTGNLEAAIKSMEEVDICVQHLITYMETIGGVTVILADHGNCDVMYHEKNGIKTPHTAHTLAPVPFVIIDPKFNNNYVLTKINQAGLANVAATLCDLLGVSTPIIYEQSLIKYK